MDPQLSNAVSHVFFRVLDAKIHHIEWKSFLLIFESKKRYLSKKESLDPIHSLTVSKRIKWSLKYHLSIFQYEVTHEMTSKSQKVKTSIDNNHLIYLSGHLVGLLKWKYGVRAF